MSTESSDHKQPTSRISKQFAALVRERGRREYEAEMKRHNKPIHRFKKGDLVVYDDTDRVPIRGYTNGEYLIVKDVDTLGESPCVWFEGRSGGAIHQDWLRLPRRGQAMKYVRLIDTDGLSKQTDLLYGESYRVDAQEYKNGQLVYGIKGAWYAARRFERIADDVMHLTKSFGIIWCNEDQLGRVNSGDLGSATCASCLRLALEESHERYDQLRKRELRLSLRSSGEVVVSEKAQKQYFDTRKENARLRHEIAQIEKVAKSYQLAGQKYEDQITDLQEQIKFMPFEAGIAELHNEWESLEVLHSAQVKTRSAAWLRIRKITDTSIGLPQYGTREITLVTGGVTNQRHEVDLKEGQTVLVRRIRLDPVRESVRKILRSQIPDSGEEVFVENEEIMINKLLSVVRENFDGESS